MGDAANGSEHWAAAWLARVDGLDREIERWPAAAEPFATGGRPIKVFVDGRLSLRLRADDDGVTVEFLQADGPMPGCEKRGGRWQATFVGNAEPSASLLDRWLEVLSRAGAKPKAAVPEEPVEDDAYRWVWRSRERLTDRNLYDFDRQPFSGHLRKAFGRLSADEQTLLRAQWEREEQEDGPTVAEALGWPGKKVMDTYKSAMASLRKAATTYERPRRKRR